MALRSAHGGHVVINGTPDVVVPNDRWSATWRVRETEVTQSDSGGCSLYFPVLQDNEWEFTAARDDTNYPEAIGLTPGTIVDTIYFKLGGDVASPSYTTKADKLENTTVTEVSPVVDNKGDVVRVTVRGKGGLCTPNQTI